MIIDLNIEHYFIIALCFINLLLSILILKIMKNKDVD